MVLKYNNEEIDWGMLLWDKVIWTKTAKTALTFTEIVFAVLVASFVSAVWCYWYFHKDWEKSFQKVEKVYPSNNRVE